MWLFAVLVVLAMGVVAMVAAGRGAPLAEAYDDRVDATVPAAGPVSADDLRRVRFPLAFRGYRMQEVDALLDRLAAEREEAATVVADDAPEPIPGPESEPMREWSPPPVDGPPPPA
ncbi:MULTISPECIES: DivIVA domain-containing protein [unclassified Nocardioides]|uniref:DivIVA domain-containing protein n=1 Tax=unclassified Nocardioides TaxID=2615069 RepID=UPI003014D953